jgi:hypothetical protein
MINLMRSKNLIPCLAALAFIFSLTSCEKKTEQFTSEPISDYMPAAVGKYITYRLDSTVFTNFGRNEELHRYQVKHVVDAQVPDNLGRPSYRIVRYLRDSLGTQPWVENGTYFITNLTDQAEVIEDNLRYIKLHLPLKINTDWKGNKYLSNDPFASLYTLNNDDDMNDWDYNFEQFDPSITIAGKTVNDVYTITQIDDAYNSPVTDIRSAGWKTFAREQYSKNIGLVTRDFILWEYQPAPGGTGLGYKTGFGIKMWMIDHN